MRNNKKKGFTLVELLVVIAILAILATVSVVGYTSFIERADVSTDEQLAAQLNNFLVAVKADSNGPFYGEDITEDNIWEVTQYILHDSGLEGKLVPNSAKHGYHFYFDLTDGKYMVLKDNKALAENSGIDKIINLAMKVYAAGEDLHAPGNCFTVDNRYFLVDTEGSNLANVIRQFYTFDEENAEDKFNFTEFYALSQGSDIPTALKALASQSVFVTKEGMFKGEGTLTNIFFHDDEGLQLMETPNITLTAVDGKVAPIVIPANVKYFGIGAINVTVNGTASNAPVIIERYAEELSTCLSEDFTNVNFVLADGKEWQMTIGATGGEYAGTPVITTVEASNVEYPIGGTNTMADFDIFVNASNKSYTSEMENTNGVNVLNVPTIVWHTGSITLGLYEKDIKAEDTTKPVSSKRVKWTLTDNYGPCVQLTEEGVLTFSRGEDGLYPDISSISVTATAVRGETAKTFTINLSRGTGMAVTVDGNSATEVLWGEDASEDDGLKNSYTIGATLNAWANKVSDNFTYDDDVVLDESSDVLTVNGTTVETATNILSGNTANTTISFDVIVGGYYKETVTLTLNHARVLYTIKNTDLKYIGTEGATVSASDLFTLADGATAPAGEVKVNAYLGATAGASMSNLNPLPIGSSTNQAVYAEGDANANSVALSNGAFNLGLKSEANTATAKVVFVVTVDGVRASENYEVTVVNGTNAKNYTTLKAGEGTAKNIVLLSDVTMDVDNSYISVKNFYGNCFTFDIQKGTKQSVENVGSGVINLYGTLQDVKIIGRLHTGFGVSVSNEWGSCAVTTKATGAKILNSYISNCRSPLRVEANTTVEDSIFFGGRFSNIEIISSKTLTIEGEVVTINQPYEGQVGTGITAWYTATNYAKVVVTGLLTQYNFISEADAAYMPEITVAGVGADLGVIFKDLINNNAYSGYKFGSGYVNAGIAYLNKVSTDESFVEPEFNHSALTSAYQSTDYELTDAKAYPSGVKSGLCSLWGHYNNCADRLAFKTGMAALLDGQTSMKNIIYSYHNGTGSYGHTVFASQAGAVAKYKPGTVSAPVYDFVNGSIIH